MKTNVVLKSTDRNLFGVVIKQQTKDGGSLSVTDLQKSYNTARWQYGWSEQNITSIMSGVKFKERLFYVLKERDLIKLEISSFMEMVENEGIVAVLKGLGLWKTKGRGENKSVYCDPYIWVSLAMELNPMIYAKVVMWLTDTLIFDRVEAGSAYLPMNKAISKIVTSPDYSKYAKDINKSIFGYHETGMRNTATSEDLKKISDLEKYIYDTINDGFVKTEADVLRIIENYRKKI